jgi:lysophospholipase L1-like esterase
VLLRHLLAAWRRGKARHMMTLLAGFFPPLEITMPNPQTPKDAKPRALLKRQSWRRRLLALGLGCLVGLVALKVCDLVVGWAKHTQTRHWLRLAPNASVRHRSTEFDYVFTTNRLGFRGPDVPFEKPPQTLRVVVLGDSFAAGLGVADEDVFTVQLERRLNSSHTPTRLEVVNLAQVGSSTIRQLDVYEEFGTRFEPDLVLLAFFLGNDLAEIVEEHDREELAQWRPAGPLRDLAYTCFPNLYLELAMLKQTAREQRRLQGREEADLVAEFRQEALRRGQKPQWAEERFRRLPEDVRRAACEGLFPQIRLMQACLDPQRLRRTLNPDDEFFQRAWPRVERHLEKLRTRTSADAAKLLVVVFPASVQVDPEAVAFNRSIGFDVDEDWLSGRCRTQEALHQWADQAGVPLLDLTDALRESNSPVYHVRNSHFNPAAHSLVARKLASWPPLIDTEAPAAGSRRAGP